MVVLMSVMMKCSQHFCLHIARHVCICLLCGGCEIGVKYPVTTYNGMQQVLCTKPVLASNTVERLWQALHESTPHKECMLRVWWRMLNPVNWVQFAG